MNGICHEIHMEDGDAQLSTLLNNLTVISVSRFDHVQDFRRRMGSLSHILQSNRKGIQTHLELRM